MNTSFPIDTTFEIEFANEIARLESFNKHYYRPNTYLHKWWARRCGSTFRLILKHLVVDPAQRGYYTPGGLAGRIVLDPMMGGGTTLHEAIRLGANVIGVDIDPIPVLQARATLSDVPLESLTHAFAGFHHALRGDLDPLFETHCPVCAQSTQMQYLLYGWRRSCECGPALFVDDLILRQAGQGAAAYTVRLCPPGGAVATVDQNGQEVERSEPVSPPSGPIFRRSVGECVVCKRPFREDRHLPYYARYEPLVIAGICPQHRLFFKALDAHDHHILAQANARRADLPFDPVHFAIEPGRKSRQLILRHIDNYLDLFSSRQLLYLERAIAWLPYFEPVAQLNLALLVSTSLEFNSLLSGYKGASSRRSGAIRHTFSHHAYTFPYTALENNPLFRRSTSGTLHKLFQARVRRGREWAAQPRERVVTGQTAEFRPILGELDAGKEVSHLADLQMEQQRFWLMQRSAATLPLPDGSVDFIVTDPPYYDSVQYSDLAAFFRVWLRHLLPFSADWGADWEYDVAGSAVDPHKNDRASRYTDLLAGIFQECRRVLRPLHGRFIFTFHHWNPKGWAALTIALQRAGFCLWQQYVVHAENPVSVHIQNMKALMHDAILVCVPIEAQKTGVWERPSLLNPGDSAAFTRDCAVLLGWLLEQRLPEESIQAIWRTALP